MKNQEFYLRFSIKDLIVLAICSIQRRKEDCTFEKLVYECFTLFPKKFSLSRYPEWPDSHKLDRHLRKIQEHNLISGSRETSYYLTPLGLKKCEKLRKKMGGKSIVRDKAVYVKGKKEKKIMDTIRGSLIYKQFAESGRIEATGSKISLLFFCTEDTPKGIVIQNILYALDLAEGMKDEKLVSFIKYCLDKMKRA